MNLPDRISMLTRIYATESAALAAIMTELQDEIEKLKRRRLPAIRRAAMAVVENRAALAAAIEANPSLFVRPRTIVLHGVRLGIVKGKGKIDWGDDAYVVAMIRKKLSARADVLIRVVETPIRAALAELDASDLMKIGVSVEEAGERVFIKAATDDIDKLVTKLLADAEPDDAR